MTDRNSTTDTRGIGVTDMIDMQGGPRGRPHRRTSSARARRSAPSENATTSASIAAAGTEPFDHPADLPSRRVRLGRWMVAVGQAIAGPRPMTPVRDGEPLSAAYRPVNDPCGDGDDRRHDGRLNPGLTHPRPGGRTRARAIPYFSPDGGRDGLASRPWPLPIYAPRVRPFDQAGERRILDPRACPGASSTRLGGR